MRKTIIAMVLPKVSFKTAASVALLILCGRMVVLLSRGNGASSPLSPGGGGAATTSVAKVVPTSTSTAKPKKPRYLELQFRDDALNVIEPRVYRSWPVDEELPCYDDVMKVQRPLHKANNYFRERESYRRGFLYMRPPKCASTTVGGVNMRIARNEFMRRTRKRQQEQPQEPPPEVEEAAGKQRGDPREEIMEALRNGRRRDPYASQSQPPMCDLSFSHGGRKRGRRFQGRVRDESYLWTVIREPTSRHVSFFWFWGVSANHKNTTDDAFQEFVWQQNPDYYFNFLSPRYNVTKWREDLVEDSAASGAASSSTSTSRPKNSTMTYADQLDEVKYLMEEYDFIGITERLDESLVVLGMLLRLPLADLLYYSAKASDNFYIDPETKNKCIVLLPSVVSPGMAEFFVGDAWRHRITSDALLYRAAERSLDKTIDALGRDLVQQRVEQLRAAQRVVVQRCRGKIRMECEVEGEPPNKAFDCLHHDMGCGMTCLDQVATELDLW